MDIRVLVDGPRGCGKTHLLERIKALLVDAGFTVGPFEVSTRPADTSEVLTGSTHTNPIHTRMEEAG